MRSRPSRRRTPKRGRDRRAGAVSPHGRGLVRRHRLASNRMTARAIARSRLAEERGVTLIEMLVVLAILGIVLGGHDDTLRLRLDLAGRPVESGSGAAERATRARRAATRDPLRVGRHLNSASVAHDHARRATVRSRQRRLGVVHVVRRGSVPDLALWRYPGTLCSGAGDKTAETLVSSTIFTYSRATADRSTAHRRPPSVGDRTGAFRPGTYTYDVTAVHRRQGHEVSGAPKT